MFLNCTRFVWMCYKQMGSLWCFFFFFFSVVTDQIKSKAWIEVCHWALCWPHITGGDCIWGLGAPWHVSLCGFPLAGGRGSSPVLPILPLRQGLQLVPGFADWCNLLGITEPQHSIAHGAGVVVGWHLLSSAPHLQTSPDNKAVHTQTNIHAQNGTH